GEVVRYRRVRMVVGETAVDFAEQFLDFAADGFVEFFRICPGDAIAAIDGDLHRPLQPYVGLDAGDIVGRDVEAAFAAFTVAEFAVEYALTQGADRLARQRLTGQHHFQAVVIGRIMAAGDHDAALGAQMVGGEIDHGGRHHAEVDDVDAGFADAARQGGGEFRAGQATIVADADFRLSARCRFRAQRMADGFDDLGSQGLADDATNVIGLEYFLRDLHEERPCYLV